MASGGLGRSNYRSHSLGNCVVLIILGGLPVNLAEWVPPHPFPA